MTSSIQDSWNAIEGVLREHAQETYGALGRGATKAQITKLELTLGNSLPVDLAESLCIHNGLRKSYLDVNRLFNYEALLSTTTIAKQWKMMRKLVSGGHFDDTRCDLTRTRKLKHDAWWREGWIPFTDADGSGYCVDLDPASSGTLGQIFYFYHNGGQPRTIVAKNYRDWLSKFARTLQRGNFELDDGDIWID